LDAVHAIYHELHTLHDAGDHDTFRRVKEILDIYVAGSSHDFQERPVRCGCHIEPPEEGE
jgi:hypothetical protein